ncbi:DUF5801 repeats-in-toxin domain-containing protein [Marinobacter sp.]|uniref:DUF5801 repeats-in-toxin domain-containing protein n=1 Tax=Marinobacter sp. TaxID=50741 RepID=UPI002B2784B4|nr:DUF5801 repeats-in-toxin domain-containing protein [Marinobacter sp.]
MTTLAIVVSLVGQAWAENANGERRVLEVGDQLAIDETLIMDEGARIDLDFGDNQQLTFVGEQQVTAEERGGLIEQVQSLEALEASEQPPEPTASTEVSQRASSDGHSFVQLVRIGEIIEADGYTPVTVARIQEVLRPFGLSLPQREFVQSSERDGTRYDEQSYPESGAKLSEVSISIDVIAGDDIVDATESGQIITLTGKVGGGVSPGDPVTVTVNGQLYSTTVNADGKTWQVDVPGSELANDSIVQAAVNSVEPNGTPVSADAERPYGVDDLTPSATVALEPGSGPNGEYSADDTGGGKVTGTVTFDPNTTEPGDTVKITDKDGNVIIERPITQGDIDNGIPVDVPVSDGQTAVELNVDVTDPAGNTSSTGDNNTVDNGTPTLGVELEAGSGPNGAYNDSDASQGSVEGMITFDPANTQPGDKVSATDKNGNPVFDTNGNPVTDYELTQYDIDNGLVVEVPITGSDTELELKAEVTDSAGNSTNASDSNPVDAVTPTLTIELEGAGPDDTYSDAEIISGKVTANVALDNATVEVGDQLVIKDTAGTVIVDRPVTAADIANGVSVEISVAPGANRVSVDASITDPAGNTSNAADDKAVDATAPTVNVGLEPGSGPNGEYNDSDTSDGKVEGTITFGPETEVGDKITVTDKDGNPVLDSNGDPITDYEITQGDIDNGITVAVPVQPGDTDVELNVEATDPAGNTNTSSDRNDVDSATPGATATLNPGSGPNGEYNTDDTDDGKVTGTVTFDPNTTEPGDTVKITDKDGNVIIERPITQGDIDNGIPVDVPVSDGQTDVELNVDVTDPAGNTSSTGDSNTVDNITPTLGVTLDGAGTDGVYNESEITNGRVPATITLDPTVEVGDVIEYTDGNGDPITGMPAYTVTGTDITNGNISVQVPVAPGQTDVELNATITDPAGNTSTVSDNKAVDNLPPETVTPIDDQSSDDADVVSLDISGNFNDLVSGSDITYSASGLPDGLSIDPNTGIISGTIDRSASQFGGNGEHTVTVTVTDEAGNSDDVNFNWGVNNPAPVAVDDSAIATEDQALTVSVADGVLANDYDPDGDAPLVVTDYTINGQSHSAGDTAIVPGVGQLTLNADGSYEFVPEADYNGAVPTISYTVEDADGGTDTGELVITMDPVLDITLSAPAQVNEGDKITVTASVETPVQDSPLYVVLDNGQTITIPVGAISGSIDVDSRPDDDYVQGQTDQTFEVVSASGGSETINSSSFGASATVGIVDTDSTVTARLSVDNVSTEEGAADLVYTVTLEDANGNAVVANNDVTVVTNRGSLTISAGNSSGTLDVAVQGDDVYIDGNTVSNEITSVSEANAGVSSSFEDLDFDGTAVQTEINDTIDPVYAIIEVDNDAVLEGGALSYTVTLVDANGDPAPTVAGKNATVNLAWSGAAANAGDVDALPANVTVSGGSATASFVVNISSDTVAELSEPLTVTIDSVVDNAGTDPGFENLQVGPNSNSATAQVIDGPTIKVLDDNGAADGQLTVNEQGLDTNDGSNTVSGVLRITAPSGLQTIEIGGETFTLAQIENLAGNNQTITVAGHGEITLKASSVVETANGQDAVWEVDFDYKLTDAQTHTGQGADNALKDIPLSVNAADPQDANNSVTGSGNLGVLVTDDIPDVDLTGAKLDEAQVEEAQIGSPGGAEASVDFSGAFDINYGADGDNGVVYELVIDSNVSGLVDTASGDAVVLFDNNGVVEGRNSNGDVVFTITVDGATGEVTLVQNRALAHQDPLTPNDTVKITNGAISLKATATDGDNDTDTAKVNIGDRFVFQDDGPTAVADSANATEGGSASGNVLGNDDAGSDGWANNGNAVVGVIFGGGSAVENTNVGQPVSGLYGTLTLNSDGSYDYLANPDSVTADAQDVFTYTVKDGDGDLVETTLTINMADVSLPPVNSADSVNESGLAGGTTAGDDSHIASGQVTLPTGVEAIPQTGVSTQHGEFSIDKDGNYTYTLTGSTDGDAVTDSFEYTTRDANGNTVTNTVAINIADDQPIAEVDTGSVDEGATLTVGAGSGVLSNDQSGADGWDVGGAVVGVAAGDTQTSGTVGVGGRIDGQHGYLTLNADGSYEYVSTANVITADAQDVFTYTVRDADGDLAYTTLTIDVADISLPQTPITETVYESGLVGGSTEGDNSQIASGQITLPAGAEAIPQSSVSTQYGVFSIDKDGNYTYTLTSITDGDTVIDSFTYETQDANGNTVTNTVTINITDDVPVARDDTNSITEETASVSGNVMGGNNVSANDVADDAGADGACVTDIASTNEPGNTASSSMGNLLIEGEFGTLTINPDGTYNYVLDNTSLTIQGLTDTESLIESFTYTLEDGDGDTSTAKLDITINGSDDGVLVTVPVDNTATTADGDASDQVVFESGLVNGSSPNAADTQVVSTFTVTALDGVDPAEAVTVSYTDASGSAAEWMLSQAELENLSTANQSVTTEYGELLLKGFTQAADGTITVDYDYTLNNAPDVNATDTSDEFGIAVKDRDGDTDNQNLTIKIEDDAPSIENTGAVLPDVQVSESALGTTASSDFSGAFSETLGADGGTVAYELVVNNATSGLTDTATGEAINLVNNGGVIEGRTATGNDLAFTVAVDASGSVILEQNRALQHGDTSTPSDVLHIANGSLSLEATATDGDGDTDSASVAIGDRLVFQDDGPVANDDTATIEENSAAPVTGNVAANDTLGGDDASVTGVTSTNAPGNTATDNSGVLTLDGQYGTLTINLDGTYSYALDSANAAVNALKDGETLPESFNYTLTDGDGDKTTANLTITINGNTDGAPAITAEDGNGPDVVGDITTQGELTVQESGLTDGSSAHTGTGNINISAADGLESITVGGKTISLSELQALNTGTSSSYIIINTDEGQLTLTDFNATSNVGGIPTAGDLNYSYELTDVQNTPADPSDADAGRNSKDTIALEVTDAGGDTNQSDLTINIIDDTPQANADTGTVTEGSTLTVSTNDGVLSNDDSGTDGSDTNGGVVGVVAGSGSGTTEDAATVGQAVNGTYGVLTLNADGSYSYVSSANAVTADAQDVFTYTVKDGDGDLVETTLTIDVNDVTGTPQTTTATVDEAGLAAGTDAGSDSHKITGGQLALDTGWAVNGAQNGTSTHGTWSVAADGTFSYELTNATTEGADDTDSFTYEVVDQYGNTVTNTVNINITDDTPQAADDATSISEDGTASVTGDVLANDELGADAQTNPVAGVGFGGTAGTVGNSLSGQFGDLTLNADGTYTYALDNDNASVNALKDGETLTEDFSYIITDADGDTRTATLTVTIDGSTDGAPGIAADDGNGTDDLNDITTSGHATVYEKGFVESDDSEKGTGSIAISTPDGLESITVGGTVIDLAALQGLNPSDANTHITVVTNEGTLTVTGFTPSTTVGGIPTAGSLDYSYELSAALSTAADPNDPDAGRNGLDIVDLEVTDAGGETSNGELTINIIDDQPTADDDSATAPANDFAPVTGDIMTNDREGADGARVTQITDADNNQIVVPATGNVVINGTYGKLTLESDGSYSYQRNSGSEGGVSDEFTYTLTDGDGDTTLASLTVTIGDSSPVITNIPANVDVNESGLPDGSGTAPNNASTQGQITFTSPDGVSGLALGGYTLSDVDQTFADGLTARYSYDPVTGQGTIYYDYTLPDKTSGDNAQVDFAIEITDQDGDTSTPGDLTIDIIDDVPVVMADAADVTEGDTVSGNVLANDTAGADGWDLNGAVVGVVAGAGSAAENANVGTVISGSFGDLTLNADGSYSYFSTANAVAADAQDVFTYTVKDGDGDLTQTTLTIDINHVTGTPANTDASVDEDGLPAGTNSTSDSNETSGSLNLQAGWSVKTAQSDSTSKGSWSVDTDGKFTYELTSPTDDIDGADETDTFTYTAVDQYGNTVENTVTINIVDDGPEVSLAGINPGSLTVDETTLGTSTENNEFVSGVFDFAYGADDEDTTVYSLNVIDGTASGVTDTVTGTAIHLFMDGNDVVGRVGNDSSGDVAFSIEINANTGAATLTQNRPLEHLDTASHNDELRLTDSAVQLVATAEDGDGDTGSASADVGNNFIFKDDGPSISLAPTGGTVDEAHLSNGSAATKDTVQIKVSNSLNVEFGADDAGDVQFTEDGEGSTKSSLEALGLKSGGEDLVYEVSNDNHTLTAYKGSAVAGNEVFTVEITYPTDNPGYEFTLSGAIDHINEFDDTVSGLNLEFDGIEVTDGDNDSINTGFTIKVMDDAPEPTDLQIHTVDEDSDDNIFVTNADSTGDNTTIAPSHGTATVNADGTITYVPSANYSGTDTFTYTTTTDNDEKTYTVEVTVNPISDAPDLEADKSIKTREDTPVDLVLETPVIVDDSDLNGADDGDNPERLGAITLTLDDDAPPGTVLTKSGGTALIADAEGGYTVVIVENSGNTVADTDLHLSEGLPTVDVNYLTKDEYEALKIEPAEDRHENVEVTVSVTSYEVDSDGKKLDGVDGANSQQTISVDVQAVTDVPEISLVAPSDPLSIGADSLSVTQPSGGTNGKITVSMAEDKTLDLQSVLEENLTDTDGSESYWYSITGLPEGTIVSIGGTDYTADASGNISIPEGDYLSSDNGANPSLSITPPKDYSSDGAITATITLNTLDKDADSTSANPVTESVSVDLELTVTPVAGDVTAGDVETEEDTAVNFLEHVLVTDTGTGTEVINSVSFEIPAGWEITAPVASSGWSVLGDGSAGNPYTITFNDDGSGGATVLDETAREAVLDGFTITPPAHSSADASIELKITTTDSNGTGTDAKETTETVGIKVTPVGEVINGTSDDADPDDLGMVEDHAYQSSGEEDVWFALGTDSDGFDLGNGWSNEDSDGSEKTFALLTPELIGGDGSQADANGSQFRYNDGSGLVTQTFGGEAIEVPVEYLDTLEFLAPPDFAGMFEVKVEALTRDTDPDPDDGAVSEKISGESTLTNILIKPSADTPTTTVTARVNGNEDESVPLSIRPTSSDLSETFNVTINAIPDGAEIVYDGQILNSGATGLPPGMTITDNGDGTWKVEITDFDPDKGANMTLTPPEHSNKPFTLSVSTVSVDKLTVSGTDYESVSTPPFELSINVTPKGDADPANVTVEAPVDQSFEEETVDTEGGVMLEDLLVSTPSLTDNDGSETLSFKLSNLPAGFGVEGATSLGNGEWVFAASELGNVKITTPANFSGTSGAFTLAAVTTENDGDSLTDNHSVQIRIKPSPEATMNLGTDAVEDTPAKLDFSAQQENGETGETITEVWIKASDLSGQNFTLTYGENGSALAGGQSGVTLEGDWYKLNSIAMDNIYLKGNDNWHGNGSFTVQYRVEDPGDDGTVKAVSEMSGDQTYNVSVAAITDQPELTVTAGSNIDLDNPGTATIDLNIANQGGDYDGSEQLTRILLDNVPEGVIVEGADFIGGNQWLFITSDDFGSALTPSINLKVQSEAGGLIDHKISITVTTEDDGNGALKMDTKEIELTTAFTEGNGSQQSAEIVAWEQDDDFSPTEDAAFTLSDAFDGEIESGVTENGFNITLSNLPVGTVVTGMTATVIDGETIWTKSGAGGNTELQTLLNNITVTPPAEWNQHDGDFVFNAELTTYVPSGLRSGSSVEALFDEVQPVSDEPEISISAPAVDEGNDLTFTINMANTADTHGGAAKWTLVDGKLYLKLDESGIEGAGVLKHGGAALNTTLVSGGNGLPGGDYYVIDPVDPSSPVELTYTPATDYVDGSVSLSAWAQGQEDESAVVVTGSATATGQVNPVNGGYDFTVNDVDGTENASQLAEDGKSNVIQLPVADNGLSDSDGSEALGAVLLSNVPNGFLVFVGDNAADATAASLSNNAGGDGTSNSWLLGHGEIPAYIGIMPPQYWSGTVSDLTLQITSGEGDLTEEDVTEKTFDLTVSPQADGVTLAPTPSFGEEGEKINLNLNHELKDPVSTGAGDASTETLTLEFSGMGEHAAFYLDGSLISGTNQVNDDGGGNYTISGLSSEEAEKLSFMQAKNALNDVKVRAQTVETDGGDTSAWTDWKDINTKGVIEQYATTGTDTLLWTGDVIDGFGGEDTIQLRFGEEVTGNELSGNLSNIEKIDMTGMGTNSIGTLTAQDVLDMTDGNNKLTISGDDADSVSLDASGWQVGANDGTYTIYTAAVNTDTVTLEVQNTLVD